ncbi:putative purine permease 11 [Gossypium australe]|uniref:Putative purine permease 11 n=1 Tax=Gossypium australe TaxID=47621 RepID=A0A5B6UC02_9ROSI|nr:putative purine permease 11 [Gossypium australe]
MIPMDTMLFHSKMRAMMWGLEMSWRFPPRGWLKFNVCGVVFENKAGGGGVLRDEDGVARALFSGPSEAKDSELAELKLIGVALELYEGMGWATCCPLLIEVGSNKQSQ